MKLIAAGVAALVGIAAASAQDGAPPPAACTTGDAPFRDFDFWIGEWEVFNPQTGAKIGENTISRRENGCLILEQWSGAGGGTGTSMNFYDPVDNAWRQVWQSPFGFIDMTGGLDEAGAMALEGAVTTHASGETSPIRGVWTPRDDGAVIQRFFKRDAETNEWKVSFTGEYRRKAEAAGHDE